MAGPEAIALLDVPLATLAKGLISQEDTGGMGLFANDSGQLLGLTRVAGGTLVYTFLPFFSSADELSLGIGQLLGDKLLAHRDLRGVFVIPDHRLPEIRSYRGLIEEGEVDGLWVPLAAPSRVSESIERRTEQVIEFMAQMTALNRAHKAGDDKSVRAARHALQRAFAQAHDATVRTSHPIASRVRKGGKKAVKSLMSAFEGVKLDGVQLPEHWQRAADEARALIQQDLAEVTGATKKAPPRRRLKSALPLKQAKKKASPPSRAAAKRPLKKPKKKAAPRARTGSKRPLKNPKKKKSPARRPRSSR